MKEKKNGNFDGNSKTNLYEKCKILEINFLVIYSQRCIEDPVEATHQRCSYKKMCRKFTREHPWRNAISIKLQSKYDQIDAGKID